MDCLSSIRQLVEYGDSANELVFGEVCKLSAEQLDRALDLGMGSVRKICKHVVAGEVTWLARISGNVEAKWPASPVPDEPAAMAEELRRAAAARQTLLAGILPEQLDHVQKYRDSRGTLYQATLHEMLLQMIVHSTYHRAQIVNGIRRVGGKPPEVDFMYMVRRPA